MDQAIDRYCELLKHHGLRLIGETDPLKKTFTREEIQELESFNHAPEKDAKGWAFLSVLYAYTRADINGIAAGTPRPACKILTDAFGIYEAYDHLYMLDDCVVMIDWIGSTSDEWDTTITDTTCYYDLFVIQPEYLDWLEGRTETYKDPYDDDEESEQVVDADTKTFDSVRIVGDDSSMAPEAPPIEADDFHICSYSLWEQDAYTKQEFDALTIRLSNLTQEELNQAWQDAHDAFDIMLKTKEGRQQLAAHPLLGTAVIGQYIITMRLYVLQNIISFHRNSREREIFEASNLYLHDDQLEDIRNGSAGRKTQLTIDEFISSFAPRPDYYYHCEDNFTITSLIKAGRRLVEEPNKPHRYEDISGIIPLVDVVDGGLGLNGNQTALLLTIIAHAFADIDGKGAGTPRTAREYASSIFDTSAVDSVIPDIWTLHKYGILGYVDDASSHNEHRFYLRDTFLEWMQQNERGIRTHYQFIGVYDRIQYPHQITFDESTRSYVRIQREEEFFSKHEYDTIISKLNQRDIAVLESMKEELHRLYKADPYFTNSFEHIAQHPVYNHCVVEGSIIPFRAYMLRYILTYIAGIREMVDSWHLPE